MKLIFTSITIFIVTLWFSTVGLSQVVADFTSNTTQGCSPLLIHFQDQSIGNIVWRNWDFGNGTGSNMNNPVPDNIYLNPGMYTVTLTVSDGVDTASISKMAFIQVLVPPVANFNHQNLVAGCAVFPFSVTDASTYSNAPISTWVWDFDDGTTAVYGQNVTHDFVGPGTFSVTLTVIDTQGCSNSHTIPNLVSVDSKPIASFNPQGPISNCVAPLTVTLNSTSSGTAPLSYFWNVGGSTYTSPNITKTFTVSGGYDVELIVTNSTGCSDTITKPSYIYIGNVQANFLVPDTVCPGFSVSMSEISLGGNNFFWNFGDGSSASGNSVTHAYVNSGSYLVTMVASSGPSCMDSISQIINVESITAAFTSTPHYSCEAPLTVNFTDQSIGDIASWNWNFGNIIGNCPFCTPNTSNIQNPTNVYWNAGYYDDTLTVISHHGCASTVIVPNNEQIEITQAEFLPDVIDGCAPLTVNFANTTLPLVNIGTSIWSFNDGTANSNIFSPSHTFVNPGEYDVELAIVTLDGCTTLYQQRILVGTLQNANFGIDTIIACGTDTVSFFNYSTDTNLIDEYIWFFGDGDGSGDYEPWHVFTDTGSLAVTLIVGYNGCRDTLEIDSMIQILGPIINFAPIMDCDSPNYVGFIATPKGGTNFYWDFGDSSLLDSSTLTPFHTYPPFDANYDIDLFFSDSVTGCSMLKTNSIHIRYLEGVLTVSDSTICKHDMVSFSTGSSTNALGVVQWGYNQLSNWVSGVSIFDYVFHQNGVWDVYAVVSDENGCEDTLIQAIQVYEPIPDFSLSPTVGCSPLQVFFTDLTNSDTNIVSWTWKFGDGTTSNLQNPSHTYTPSLNKLYDVELVVTDTFGCEQWVKKKSIVSVQKPPSSILANNPNICDGDSVTFFGISGPSFTYLWDFGDGTTSTLSGPTHVFSTGLYTVSLTVTNAIGCDSTHVKIDFIEVQPKPIANFVANPIYSTCYPTSVVFTDSSIVQSPMNYVWNFGDSPNNVTLNVPTAQNLYTQPGIYDVMLVVTSTYGCTDTIIKPSFITVKGPVANVIYTPSIGCVGEPISFDVDHLNGQANLFVWGFGDGIIDSTHSPNPEVNHIYYNPGVYKVIMIYSDSLGLCTKIDTVDIEIDEVISSFIISDSAGCTPLVIGVVSQSIGEDQWNWNVNGNFNSSSPATSIQLIISGFHEIGLIVSNSVSKCADTSFKSIEVYPLPTVDAGIDQTICIGSSSNLLAIGAKTYVWNPSRYLNDSIIANPITTPEKDIVYTVIGIDSNSCVNQDSIQIKIQYKPELIWFPTDTSIFNGEEYFIRTLANMPLNYLWSPSVFLDCVNCAEPVASPTGTTVIELQYTDKNGCFTFDTAFVIEVSDEFNINIPNAFTPNWDGTNDTFKPSIFGIKELVYMRIYDRWGELVFETSDITQGWDGRIKGKVVANNSVFSYKIKVRRFNGDEKDFIGMVVLISH